MIFQEWLLTFEKVWQVGLRYFGFWAGKLFQTVTGQDFSSSFPASLVTADLILHCEPREMGKSVI